MGAETLASEGDFEIDTELWDMLQGVKQEDCVLKDKEKLDARERPGTLGEEQVGARSRHKRTVVTNERNCHFQLWPRGNWFREWAGVTT